MGNRKLGPIPKALGKRLRDLRLARGLTQAQLAGDDFTKGFISHLEHGLSRMSLRSAEILAQRLNVPVGVLLDDRTQLRLNDARAALEHALELCDEMQAYAESRRALIVEALEQSRTWHETQRKTLATAASTARAPAD